jgi:hypothetical protein
MIAPVRLGTRQEQARNIVPGSPNPIKTNFSHKQRTHPGTYTRAPPEQDLRQEQTIYQTTIAKNRHQEQAGTDRRTIPKRPYSSSFAPENRNRINQHRNRLFRPSLEQARNKFPPVPSSPRNKIKVVPRAKNRFRVPAKNNSNPLPVDT